MAVVVGNWLDINEPRGIVSYSANRNTFRVTDYSSLNSSLVNALRDSICGNNDQCASSPCAGGSTCTSILNYYICTCPAGYGGETCANVCRNPGDLIIALDASGSLGLSSFISATTFLTRMTRLLDLDGALLNRDGGKAGFRVGMLTFSTAVNPFFQLNSYTTDKALLLKAIGARYIDGNTNTAAAITVAADQMLTPGNGSRDDVADFILLITDGLSDNPSDTWQRAVSARRKSINIITIGVGPSYNYSELVGISSAPESSTVFLSDNFTTLNDALAASVSNLLCRNTNYCDGNPCQNGAKCTASPGGYSCGPCPMNFCGFNCQRRCTGNIDLVFLVDASGSVQWERMWHVNDFMARVIGDVDVGPNATRVAAVYFANSSYTSFNLNQYTTRQDVQQALRATPFLGGSTNLAAAFRTVRTTTLQSSNGARPDSRNIVIVISDGDPSLEADRTIAEANLLKNTDNTLVITVAISHPAFINFDNVLGMCSSPVARNSFNVSSYYDIANHTESVLGAMCNDVNECASSPCQNGGSCYDDYGRYFCTCPRQVAGYNCERTCGVQLDVVFILDLSGSIEDDNNYDTIIEFARAVVAGLDVASGAVQVGAVTFSSAARSEFYLNTYVRSQQQLQTAFEFVRIRGTTNAQAGLTEARNRQFTSVNGDRSSANNVIVYVSDGQSDVREGSSPSANAAQLLRDAGVKIYTVGVTASPDTAELENINGGNLDQDVAIESNDYTIAAGKLLDKLCDL